MTNYLQLSCVGILTHFQVIPTQVEEELRSIPLRMAEAWTRGSAEDFTAAFADDADFIIFDGTQLHGRENIRAFHQQIFDTLVKDTRLEAEVKLIRFIGSDVAVIHSVARMAFAGEAQTSASRNSMQLLVAGKRGGRWKVDIVLNSRILTMEQQPFWDDFNSLSAAGREQVKDFALSLTRTRHLPAHGWRFRDL